MEKKEICEYMIELFIKKNLIKMPKCKKSKKVKLNKKNLKCDLKVPADPKAFKQYFYGILETDKGEKIDKINQTESPDREKQGLIREIEESIEIKKSDVEALSTGEKKSIPKWMRKYYPTNVKLPIVKFEQKSKLSKNKLLVSYVNDPIKRKIGSVLMEIPLADDDDLLNFVSDIKLVDRDILQNHTGVELIEFLFSDKKVIGKRKEQEVAEIPLTKKAKKLLSSDISEVDIILKKKSQTK